MGELATAARLKAIADLAASQAASSAIAPVEAAAPKPYNNNWSDFYGKTIPVGYGTRALDGTIIWADEIKTSGEGDTLSLTCSFAVSFGYVSGTATRVKVWRTWIDGQLILDRESPEASLRKPGLKYTIYTGSETQAPDPTIVAVEGNANAFRGQIYIVFRDFPLTQYGLKKLPVVRAEINEFLSVYNTYDEFTRLPLPTTGDHNTFGSGTSAIRGGLVDWKRRKFYASEEFPGSEASDLSMLRTFDLDLMGEVSQFEVYDRFEPQDPSKYAESLVYAPVLATPSLQPRTYTGARVSLGFNEFAYVDDFSGLLFTALSNHFSNTGEYGWVDPNTGKLLTKTPALDHLGFAAALRYPFRADQADIGTRILCLVSDFGSQAYIFRYKGSTLRQYGAWSFDAHDYRETNYWNLPGTGTIRGLVPNEPLGTPTATTWPSFIEQGFNFFYFARGTKIWRLYISALGMFDAGREGTLGDPTWQLVHDFGAGNAIRRMVMDKGNNELFVVTDDDNVGNATIHKLSTFRELPLNLGVVPNVIETVLWSKALPFQLGVQSSFWAQHNDNDYSNGLFPAIVNYLGFGFVLIDMTSGGYELVGEHPTQYKLNPARTTTLTLNMLATPVLMDTNAIRVLKPAGEHAPGFANFDFASGDGKQALSDFLLWAAERSGYDPADISITGVDDRVWGALIRTDTEFANLVAQCAGVFGFDYFESEGKFKIVKRGPGVAPTLEFDLTKPQLAPLEEGADGEVSLKTIHDDPRKLPGAVQITYIDKGLQYQPGMQTAKRTVFPAPTTQAKEIQTYGVPIILDSVDVYKYAYQALYRLSSSNVAHELRLPQKYIRLEPSDVIRITLGGRAYTIKLAEVTLNSEWSISARGINSAVAVVPEVDVTDDFDLPPDVVTGVSFSQILFLDTPALSTGDGQAVNGALTFRTITLSAGQSGWTAARAYGRDEQDGAPSALLYNANAQPIWGYITQAPEAITVQDIDHDSALRVRLVNGTFADFTALTDDELFEAELNRALVGIDGSYEFLTFKNITDLGNGVIELTNLHRGLFGSEVNGSPAVGQFFVMLDTLAHQHSVSLDKLGHTFEFTARGIDEQAPDGYSVEGVLLGGADRPLAVVNVHATLGVGNVIDFAWTRRDRLSDYNLDDGAEPTLPLSETSEEYELEIINGAGVTVRTVTGLSTPAYSYTSAAQTADGFTPPLMEIHVRCYQMSSTVGRGFSRMVTVNVE
jgi:hypothetical protein